MRCGWKFINIDNYCTGRTKPLSPADEVGFASGAGEGLG